MSPPAIFVCAHLDAAAHALLRRTLPADSVTYADHPATSAENFVPFQQCDICFGNVPGKWLAEAPRLRWLQLESIGFEYYQGAGALRPTLSITNLKGLFDQPAAETALAGVLAHYRGIDRLVSAQPAARWVSLQVRPKMQLLHGKRVVILGNGSIGRKLRQLLEAFSCTVQNFARTSAGAELHTAAELDAALSAADIVACCLPSTPETRGFLDRRRIALLGPTALFVNIGRGPVIDEPALVEALQHERIGGAVIDVTWQEPLPATHPLWNCPRTLLLQHTGGGYQDELLDKARVFLANLKCFQAGKPLSNLVDLGRGY